MAIGSLSSPYPRDVKSPAFSTHSPQHASVFEEDTVPFKPKMGAAADGSMAFPTDDDPTLPVITVRSIVISVLLSILAATIAQVFSFKPTFLMVSTLFLQLVSFGMGTTMARILPSGVLNPGPFSIKEHTITVIASSSASHGAFAVEMFAAQRLFFNKTENTLVAIGTLLSSQTLGYGLAGVLRNLLVYQKRTFWPSAMPSVALFHSLHGDGETTRDRMRIFKRVFCVTAVYEFIPQYLAPALQAVSPWCLTLPQSPVVTNLFGGVLPNEGLGLLSSAFDWTLVGGQALYTPLIAQANQWAGLLAGVFLMSGVYSSNLFGTGSKTAFPFLSTSILTQNGTQYNQTAVVDSNGRLIPAGLAEVGLPAFATTFIINQVLSSMLVTAAITDGLFSNFGVIKSLLGRGGPPPELDPHYLAMKKYREVPAWAYAGLFVAATILAVVCSIADDSGLPVQGLLFAIFISAVLTFAIGYLTATTGFQAMLASVVQALGGLAFPGSAVANMWIVNYGSSVTTQALGMAQDLKIGQYLKIPPIALFSAQMGGTVIGAIVNYIVMIAIVSSQAEVLKTPNGNGIWSGAGLQIFESQAVAWGLFAQSLFGAGKVYFIVPMGFVIGLFLPIPFKLYAMRFPGSFVSFVNPALLLGSMGAMGAMSGKYTAMVVGFISQYYVRKYKPVLFERYNFVVSAALDGGSQFAVLIVSLVLGGAIFTAVTMPNYVLNPAMPFNRDYCVSAVTGGSS